MNTIQVFVLWAVVLSSVFFGVLSFFNLSTIEWVVSDAILGSVLYLSYLVIASFGSSKSRSRISETKFSV